MPLTLPDRPSYEFLKKLAKERLDGLRATDPAATLAQAQLAVARQYGFSSWRALKAEVDHRRHPQIAAFIHACSSGDVVAVRALLEKDPSLARERLVSGGTGLHLAIGHPAVLRVLLEYGADANTRDVADQATALHFAAARGVVESVRVLLEAGADVHGEGDLHQSGVIGWAARKDNREVVNLLIAHGARHHIFSAMALGDRAALEGLVEKNPDSLLRRRSRFESGQTVLHAAFAPPDGLGFLTGEPDYAMLALLIELGADLEAVDGKGRTPLQVALLRQDHEAMRLLRQAGAREPARHESTITDPDDVRGLSTSVKKTEPMFRVHDMRATVRWYQQLGFTLKDSYDDGGELVFAKLTFGECEFALSPGASTGPRDVSLWLYTDRVEQLYEALKHRALPFEEDLYSPFYGGRQFSIRDINGLSLIFWQPEWLR